MINVDIKITNGLTPQLKSLQRQLAKYPDEAEAKFRALTPIKSGNARRNTNLAGNHTIEAHYPYAQRLDQGWSKQAPAGMIKPFEVWVRNKLKQIFGK